METEQNKKEKKPSKRKYIIAAVCFLLLIVFALGFAAFNNNSKPDPKSERIIQKAVAARLMINNPKSLTDVSFKKIESLSIAGTELRDIQLLEKCINLRQLTLQNIKFPDKDKPVLMKLLAKLGVYDLKEKFVIDLSPLAKLTNLESLELSRMPIKDIQPLSNLVNIQQLWLINVPISDLEPLRGLTNLISLDLSYSDQISDLEPIKTLISLQELRIQNNIKITNEQVEDLQKALPKCEITR